MRTGTGAAVAGFLSPAIALYAALVLIPVVMSVVYSFLDWQGYGASQFAGMDNFAYLLSDKIFYISLLHNVILALASVAIQIPIALGLALAFSSQGQYSKLLRSLAFSPMILPSAVIAILFMLLYNPFEGPLSRALTTIMGSPPDFLGSAMVLPSLIAAISWRYIGFYMMIMLAALSSVDRSLYEAASLDGAGPFACFRHITLPSIAPTIRLAVLLAILGSLKYFDLVYIMTKGGPDHSSELMTTYLFNQGVMSGRYGYAGALATALLVVSLSIGALVASLRSRRARAEAA